jgi:hypothetical protein
MAIKTANLTVTSSNTNIVAPTICSVIYIRSRSSDNTGGYYVQDPTSGVDLYYNDSEWLSIPAGKTRFANNEIVGKIRSTNAGPFTFDIKAEY